MIGKINKFIMDEKNYPIIIVILLIILVFPKLMKNIEGYKNSDLHTMISGLYNTQDNYLSSFLSKVTDTDMEFNKNINVDTSNFRNLNIKNSSIKKIQGSGIIANDIDINDANTDKIKTTNIKVGNKTITDFGEINSNINNLAEIAGFTMDTGGKLLPLFEGSWKSGSYGFHENIEFIWILPGWQVSASRAGRIVKFKNNRKYAFNYNPSTPYNKLVVSRL